MRSVEVLAALRDGPKTHRELSERFPLYDMQNVSATLSFMRRKGLIDRTLRVGRREGRAIYRIVGA